MADGVALEAGAGSDAEDVGAVSAEVFCATAGVCSCPPFKITGATDEARDA